MHDQIHSTADINRRLGEAEEHIDALHSTIIVILASLAVGKIELQDKPGALLNLFSRTRISLRLATDPTRQMQPVAQAATNGFGHPNGHALAKAV